MLTYFMILIYQEGKQFKSESKSEFSYKLLKIKKWNKLKMFSNFKRTDSNQIYLQKNTNCVKKNNSFQGY